MTLVTLLIIKLEKLTITIKDVKNMKNALIWWWSNKGMFSYLSRTVFAHLSIPTSSVGPERHFSGIGRIVDKRWRLKPQSVGLLAKLKDEYLLFSNK